MALKPFTFIITDLQSKEKIINFVSMSSSDIPFANMSRQEAEEKPWSDYAVFCQGLMGIYVFDRKTADRLTKSELFIKHQNSPEQLLQLTNRNHPDYIFFTKDEWIKL